MEEQILTDDEKLAMAREMVQPLIDMVAKYSTHDQILFATAMQEMVNKIMARAGRRGERIEGSKYWPRC